MARQVKKKAKLAHEKGAQVQSNYRGSVYSVNTIVSLVQWPPGQVNLIADLDGSGQLGVIPALFAEPSGSTGALKPSPIACPAVYDAVARQKALDLYQQYNKENPASQGV